MPEKEESKEELSKKITLLEDALSKSLEEKITVEIELSSTKIERDSWKDKYRVLSENVSRMGKSEQLSKNSSTEIPSAKTKVSDSVVVSDGINQKIDPKDVNVGAAVILAIKKGVIKTGMESPGSRQLPEEEIVLEA